MKRNIARLSGIVLLLALCLSVTTFVGTTPSAHAAVQASQPQLLGNVKLDPYCRSLGYAKAGLTDSTYYGWSCLNAQGLAVLHINMQSACQWQYQGGANVTDATNDFYNASSALCYRIDAYRGVPDVQGYCQASGFVRATTVGSTAYDWRCVAVNGFLLNIRDQLGVCLWTYHLPGATQMLARFFNFYSTTSWQCWS